MLQDGDKAPDFELPDQNGESLKLADLTKRRLANVIGEVRCLDTYQCRSR